MIDFSVNKRLGKLFSGFVLSAFLVFSVGVVGIGSSVLIAQSFERLNTTVIQEITQLEKIRSSFSLMLLEMTTFLVLSPTSSDGGSEQIKRMNAYKSTFVDELEQYNQKQTQTDAVGEKLAIDQESIISLTEKIVNLSLQKKSILEILPFKKELKGIEEQVVFPEIQKGIDKATVRLSEERRQNEKILNVAFLTIIITGSTGIFLILFLGFLISKRESQTNQLKAQLISIVSHQLKTPLTIIMGHAELLLESRQNAGDKENIGIIRKTADNMQILIKDILDLTKIDQGKFILAKEPVDINAALDEIIAASEIAAEENKVKILFKKSGGKISVNTDKLKIGQALGNIITNGIKYNKEEGKLEIETSHAEGLVTITVKDEGIGIPKKETDMIFERFFRASNAVQKKHLGTGLGLFISRAIIEQSGGTLSFQSKEGVGTTFHVTLPAVTDKK